MDNIYSLFYQGQQNFYSKETWGSKGHKLKHSSSMGFYTNSKDSTPISFEQMLNILVITKK